MIKFLFIIIIVVVVFVVVDFSCFKGRLLFFFH